MSDGRLATTRARRVDPEWGIAEEVEFLGSGPERIFSTFHRPAGPAEGAVLLCSSILAELLAGYQEEVWLCRRLAKRGLAVRRFHYRGTGHSDGGSEDITYEALCEDAALVAARLREETGVDRIAVIGTRMGAIVASTVAAGMPGAPISYIQPVLDFERLFKEISRARTISLMNEEGRSEENGPPEDMFSIMARERSVDVLGYLLNEPLYRSLQPHKLPDELGSEPRAVQLVQVAKRKAMTPEYQRLLDDLAAKGFETTAELVNDDIAWWFHDSRRHLIPEIGDAVVPWLADRLLKEEVR